MTFDPQCVPPCATNDPNLWVGPSTLNGRLTHDEREAIRLCNTCPAINRCQDYALAHKLDNDEVWGGMTGQQRRDYVGHRFPGMVPVKSRRLDPNRPCDRGHAMSEMYYRPNGGGRLCRACNREQKRRRYYAKNAAA